MGSIDVADSDPNVIYAGTGSEGLRSNVSIGQAGVDLFANVYGAEAGNDVYTGNGGADIYDYTYAVGSMNGDRITDFDADDVIDLQFNTATQNGGGLLEGILPSLATQRFRDFRVVVVDNGSSDGTPWSRSTPTETESPTRR